MVLVTCTLAFPVSTAMAMTEEFTGNSGEALEVIFRRFSFVVKLALIIQVCQPDNRYVHMEDDAYKNRCNYSYSM